MTASYPTSAKSFVAKANNTDYYNASHVNELQEEIAALEAQLVLAKLNGLVAPAANKVLTTNGSGVPTWDAPVSELPTPVASKILTTDANANLVWAADSPDQFSSMGWRVVSETWTYASATTINVPSGATNRFYPGDKLIFVQSGSTKFVYVQGVASSVLTVGGNPVINAAISSIYASKVVSPHGFPQWFNWTPTVTYLGGTTDPTSRTLYIAKYSIIGRMAYVVLNDNITRGSGDRDMIDYSIPFVGANDTSAIGYHTLVGSTEKVGFAKILNDMNTLRVYLGAAMSSTGYVYVSMFCPI